MKKIKIEDTFGNIPIIRTETVWDYIERVAEKYNVKDLKIESCESQETIKIWADSIENAKKMYLEFQDEYSYNNLTLNNLMITIQTSEVYQ